MNIISKYIFKTTVKTQFTIFAVLMLIFMSQSYIKFVSEAVKGSIPTDLVTELLALSIPSMANFMLPLSLFLAVLFTIGSLCSQSEMVVMRSVGYSNSKLLGIIFGLALVTSIINGICTFYLSPMCEAKQLEVIEKAKSDPSFMNFEGGKFVALQDSTIYIDDENKDLNSKGDNSVKKVYIFQSGNLEKNQPSSVTLSKEVNVIYDHNDVMWLSLNKGMRYEEPDKQGNSKISKFERYDISLHGSDSQDRKEKFSAKSTQELLSSDDNISRSELQWRIVQPISIFVLTLLVVPLSMVNPRNGRFAKFIPAIAIYISYYLFAYAIKSSLARDHFLIFPGIFLVPILYTIIFTIPFNLTDTEWFKKFMAKRG